MRWMCMFRMCDWEFLFNAESHGFIRGWYQCRRCKSISVGSPDGPHPPVCEDKL